MLAGVLGLVAVYVTVLLLYRVLPGRWVVGYVKGDDGQPLRYHLNGLRVFLVTLGIFATVVWQGIVPADFFWTHRWETLATAFVVGIVFTAAIVAGAPAVRGLLADLYLGRRANPQAGRLDAKMFLYLVGATMLALNLVSFAAHAPTRGNLVHVGLFLFFLVDYLWFEEVHLYTYDFVAERVGFKLGWGCLVFYPFFYAIGLWASAGLPDPAAPTWLLGLAGVVFFAGWTLARGANLQKYFFKRHPERPRFGPFAQVALDGRVLISGFWGVSRHVNYLGELLMATGLTLALGHPALLWPWLYPLYYVALLVPRQLDDDRRCAAKYGPLWERYREAVPHRIVPWLW
jgi:protein-S-isoprenylcysteine O-methyltransferase Ste14